MGFIDQFVISVTFNTKKVIEFRKQNAWKTMLYVVLFIFITGTIGMFFSWEVSFERFRDLWLTNEMYVPDNDAMRASFFITQYIMLAMDLIAHLIIISAIAFAGSRGYRTVRDITFGESWNVTAYGITAPILVRTVVNGMGLNLSMMLIAYWGAVMLFSMMCLRGITNLPPDSELDA